MNYFYLEGGFFFKSSSASFAFCKSRQAKITLAPIERNICHIHINKDD